MSSGSGRKWAISVVLSALVLAGIGIGLFKLLDREAIEGEPAPQASEKDPGISEGSSPGSSTAPVSPPGAETSTLCGPGPSAIDERPQRIVSIPR